ncbi:MAG TPA: zinc ABC transporter substrate-binding protein [Oligoflexia bacterium]|nr:zinc ABC transporter substrate-binding protein [Oligoflexia bacterium]HMP47786.1 zinc ABC transporter substrate-binding protein [Oligoflexia bacterium]
MRGFICSFLLLILFFTIFGCDNGTKNDSKKEKLIGGIRIVATVGMVSDIIRQVGREKADVDQLIRHGVDPHLYRPTRDDIAKIMKADLVFCNGLLLEGKMNEILTSSSIGHKTYSFSDFYEKDNLLGSEEYGSSHFDPHLWMDVSIWAEMPEKVAEVLSLYLPEESDYFKSNALILRDKLEDLHNFGLSRLNQIPKSKRVLISSHDAFQYFGKAYNIEVHGVQGLSTESEAGLVRVNELVSLIVSRGIPSVFVETSVSPKTIKALVEGARARGHTISIGGSLYTDAMGAEGSPQGTYEGMMRHNFEIIYDSLS